MKIRILIACMLCCFAATAGKTVRLTINWGFTNVVEGYDHDTKIIVSVDGRQVGVSTVSKQTKTAPFAVMIPKGVHKVLIEAYAFYEGKWEAHTIANSYSLDATYETTMDFSQNKIISLVFDIDQEKTLAEEKDDPDTKGKIAPPAMASMQVKWEYRNIVEGYDHKSRMQVYIDGNLVMTSKEGPQSKKGMMTVKVPSGTHTVRIESWAYYNGIWEAHTYENEYSVDAFYEGELLFPGKSKKLVQLVFDIDTGKTDVAIE